MRLKHSVLWGSWKPTEQLISEHGREKTSNRHRPGFDAPALLRQHALDSSNGAAGPPAATCSLLAPPVPSQDQGAGAGARQPVMTCTREKDLKITELATVVVVAAKSHFTTVPVQSPAPAGRSSWTRA